MGEGRQNMCVWRCVSSFVNSFVLVKDRGYIDDR
jgi:hypothetical protein